MHKGIFFIINPFAGKGNSLVAWEEIKAKLSLYTGNISFKYAYSDAPGHAEAIAAEAACKGYDAAITVGGDGTAGEAANALAGSKTALGIIPAGTGNDFIKTIGVPKRPLDALEHLLSSRPFAIDLGEINGRKFLNIASSGFDAEVADSVHSDYRKFKSLAYVLAVLKGIATFALKKISMNIDGRIIEKDVFLVAVCNVRYYGNGLMISPDSEVDDGFFDVVVVDAIPRFEVIRFLPSVFKGRHLSHPGVNVFKGKNITITTHEPVKMQADGEMLGTTPAHIRLINKCLMVLR